MAEGIVIDSDAIATAIETIEGNVSDVVEISVKVDKTETVVVTQIDSEEPSADDALSINNETNEMSFDFSREDENGELFQQTYKVLLNSVLE